MRSIRDDSGQMLVLSALSMTVLLGFMALATDVGMLFHTKRNLQTAADAAATAAALNESFGYSATDAATASATANGWSTTLKTNQAPPTSVTSATLTVNTPPLSGFHKGNAFSYVEVYLTAPNPTFFMKLFGFGSESVTARAVAGTPGVAKNDMWLMNPTGTDLTLQGSSTIDAADGAGTAGIYLNSSSSTTISITGNSNTVTASAIDAVGNTTATVNGTTVYPNSPPESDPFGSRVTNGEPDVTKNCTATNPKLTTTTPYDAAGGVACFTGNNVDISGDTLENGTFVFENGVTAAGTGGNTTITNGTIDVYGGQFTQLSSSNLNITAPTTVGQWNDGIAILVPTTNTSYTQGAACDKNKNDTTDLMVQFGSSNQTLDGMIYAPNATLELHDQGGGGVTATAVVAGALCLSPSTVTLPSYNAAHPSTTPLTSVALVE
ncbi:MAG TPA: pilus assembly protein TadG-related protein [Silvibacterium sp.]|nr:pilus assembly protein TadG-related protein [Silvibacterium sp.]